MRRLILTVLVVFFLASLLGLRTQTARSSTASTITVYTPAHMRVISTVSGSCWTSSIAVERPDAYRCSTGNMIFDPCFVSGKSVVECPTDLIRNRGTLMKLTEALPHNPSTSSGAAWAFELSSGAMCQMGTGTITPGYPFYCTAPPVCSAPKVGANGGYEVRCGKPKTPITVGSVRSEKVVRIWK